MTERCFLRKLSLIEINIPIETNREKTFELNMSPLYSFFKYSKL